MPPWQNGEIGYDCSGLIGWAVCQVTGRDLFSEGLRVTRSMYCASEEKLRYKYVLCFFLMAYLVANDGLGNTPLPNASQETPCSSAGAVIVEIRIPSTMLA